MTDKTSFTDAEWNTLKSAFIMANMAVVSAEPSGLIGLLQEGWASSKVLAGEMRSGQPGLIKALVDDLATSEGRSGTKAAVSAEMEGATRETMNEKAMAGIDRAMAIVKAKAPQEAATFGDFLIRIAHETAEAASEGGFLGFGGTRVTAAEQSALDGITRRIRAA